LEVYLGDGINNRADRYMTNPAIKGGGYSTSGNPIKPNLSFTTRGNRQYFGGDLSK
jgi:hypothetical protein